MKEDKKPKAVDAIKPVVTPTPAPTPVPATVTPKPTSTPAPRMLGMKTIQSEFIFLTNSTQIALREVYLKKSDEYEWGKNLVPSETTVRVSETVQMFYDKPSSPDLYYDMKFVDKAGNAYAIYYIMLSDMNSAVFHVRDGSAYLSYYSLEEKREVNTDGSETLATDYSSNTDEDGYYDENGYWVTEYTNDSDYSDYSGSPYEFGDTDHGYYDVYGNWQFHGTSGSPYYDYMGDPRYGYFDMDGDWVMY